MGSFKVLPHSIREQLRIISKVSIYADEIAALLEGKTIFISLKGQVVAGSIRSAAAIRRSGKRVVTRSTTIEGQYGVAMWLDDISLVYPPKEAVA